MWQPKKAIYDANVLYPAPLRDLLIRLAQAGLVRARWTEMIYLKDFPAAYLARYGVIATHPDNFLMQLIDQMPNAVCNALKLQRASLKKPPQTAKQLLETLFHQGLEQSVTRLREYADRF